MYVVAKAQYIDNRYMVVEFVNELSDESMARILLKNESLSTERMIFQWMKFDPYWTMNKPYAVPEDWLDGVET